MRAVFPLKTDTDAALALDRAAFEEWWHLIDWRFHARGTVERLFARAYAAGFADGRSTGRAEGMLTINLALPTDGRAGRARPAKMMDPEAYRPAPTARANQRRAS